MLHKYNISYIFFDASNADKSYKYMKEFKSYDFKDKKIKKIHQKPAKGLPQGSHKDSVEHWKCPENVFGQLESSLDDRCSYFKTMDVVQYDLFHCK